MLTDARLAEVAARCAAATPGPWQEKRFDESQTVILPSVDDSKRQPMIGTISVGFLRPDGYANAAFITAARQDVPDLLADLRRLRQGLAGLEWRNAGRRGAACVWCCWRREQGHAPGCALRALVAGGA